MTVSFPRRGDVYRVAFGPLDHTSGHEIRKNRPAVVMSNDHLNELADTVLVMPITAGRHRYYHWVPIHPPEGGLTKPSRVVTEHIYTIDKRRLQRRLGELRPRSLAQLEQAIRDHFGLPEGDVLPDSAAGEEA